MTKAEERRALLKAQQTAQQPQTAQPTMTKADLRRAELLQPTQVQPIQTTPQITNTTNTIKTHGTVTQQPNKAVQAMNLNSINEKTKTGQKLADSEIKALALSKGISEADIDYAIGLNNASKTPQKIMTYSNLAAGTQITPETSKALKKGTERISNVTNYKQDYGAKEANEEAKNLDWSDTNSEKYVEYKEKLKEAEANNDYRNISKYNSLINNYQKKYKENFGDSEQIDVVKARKSYEAWQSTLSNDYNNYLKATTPEQKQIFAQELLKDKEEADKSYKKYTDALAYDELINNNILKDTASSFGKNVLGGTANIINGLYTGGGTLTGLSATSINPEGLLLANSGNVGIQDVGNALNKLNPITGLYQQATGQDEGAVMSLSKLSALAQLHPENKRLQNLFNQIATRSYQGTKEDLANELNTIQTEIYQNFKDVYTQDELDAVAEQLRHNEIYGDLAALPNAFGTVGNMVPSILIGTATGGLGEALGGGTMATAGTVANVAQQAGAMGSLGLGAYSQGMDEALQNGATYKQAQAYGALSGATEVGTEMLGGESVNRFLGQTGKSALGKVFGKVIDNLNIESKVGRIVANTISDVAGESTEEMISEALNPLWKAITYDPNALPQNADELGEYFKNILKAGVDAIPSTLIMQGAGVAGNVVKTQQVENGIIKSINESDLSQIVKNQLINEVRKASTDVKLGLEEAQYMQDKAYEKGFNLAAQSEQMKQRIPEGYSLPQSTIDILSYTENNRPGLNIAFDTNVQGNGSFVENPDGTRTITLNPNSKRAVEFTLTHELGHDLKGTGEYTQLQNLLTDYAKGKPGYQESLNQLDKTYKESGASYNLQDEATNDMLGQAIGEQEFYNKLAENPTLFNRVTNGLKNLLGNKDTKLKNKIEKLTSNALKQEYRGKQEGTQQSLSEAENDKTLAATHNLTRDKLKGILELGGFPVPSIAISDVNKLTPTQFGDITVLFDKDTINPENPANEVYDRDVWSPTFPQVDYEIDDLNVEKAAEDLGIEYWRLKDFAEEANDLDELVRRLTRNSTSDTIIDSFIKDNNLKYETKYREPEISWKNKEKSISDFVKANNISVEKLAQDDSLRQQYFEKLQQEFNKDEDEVKFIQEEIDTLKGEFQVLKDFPSENRRLLNLLQRDFDAINGEKQIDYYETNKNKLKVAEEAGLNDYLKEKLKYVYGDKWIRNDKEIFTPSGNRRSFNQLHDEYNLDNIVDAMTKQRTISSQAGLFGPFGKISANMSHRFKSIKEIRANKGSLIADENNTQLQDYKQNILDDIDELADYYRHKEGFYTGQENASESLLDLAKSGKFDVENFDKILEENVINSSKVPNELKNKIFEDLNNLKNLKTDYFEAKPQRAVGLDEISSVLIPNDLPDEQKQALTDRGIRYIEYNPDVEGDREAKYREAAQDVLFSKQNASWQQFLDKNLNLAKGTKTNFEGLPSNEELQQAETKSVENEPIVAENLKKTTINEPNKISENKPLDELRSWSKAGDRKTNAYQYDNPEVKPFFQYEAKQLLTDLDNALPAERYMREDGSWDGMKRSAVDDIATLLDSRYGYSYADIRKGLEAIINDEGSENNALSKRIEMLIDNRLRKGYTDYGGYFHDPSENYKKFLNGEEYVSPEQYDNEYLQKTYGTFEDTDNTVFSLSEDESKEVIDYLQKLQNDTTIDEDYKEQVLKKFDNLNNYKQFEDIKQEVSDYKDKMYKGISGLVDIANSTEEDVKQRPMEYKQRVDKNTANQRKFFENAETSPVIAEQTKNRVNATTYEKKANLDTLDQVREKLDERGNDMIEEWKTKTKNFTDKDVALGAILVERYQQQGDWNSAARAVEKLADMGTEAGRAVQMYSIFQRLSPETMAIYQQKALDKAFEEMKEKKTGKWIEANKDKFKLTGEDIEFINEHVENASQAADEETKQRELSMIENRINSKLPPSAGDAIKTLRRISMLFNPKTQVRNIVGNSLIMPVNDVADFIGTQIDKLISKKTGVRTTNYANPITKAKGFGYGVKQAVKDYRTKTRTSPSGSRWELEIGNKPFNENTKSKILSKSAKGLNWINDLLSAVMSGGDRPFYEAAYKNSLEGQMKANKVKEATPEMQEIAVNEGLQRTWNDNNEYTKAVLGIRKAMNKINVHGFGLGDLIIPFAKTPANLTKAMVEYSPAGFIPSVIKGIDMGKAISRGEMTAQQQKNFVNSMSKAIAGTILYAIAGTLAKSGRITGSADDDKDVKNFEQNVLGIQPYSVKWGDKTYTYSWANPLNAPLAIMADTYKMSKEDASTWDILTNGFKVAGDVLVENSFLQGIKELFSGDSITEGLVDAVTGMPESLIPTIASQIASAFDDTKRQTFEYKNEVGTIANKVKNKIPGARNTLAPQVNTFGEEIENQNNWFNVFFNPANVREAEITDSQKALYDVYEETKDKTIFPIQAPYYDNDDNGNKRNLSTEKRVEYQKASGQYVSSVYDDLFNIDTFNKLGKQSKVDILAQISQDGKKKAKEAVGLSDEDSNKNLNTLNEKIDTLNEANIPLADYYMAWEAQKGITGDKNANGKTIQLSASRNKKEAIDKAAANELSDEQLEVLYGIFDISKKVY